MCGIFGVLSTQIVDPAQFRQIGERNTARGNRAFGVLSATVDSALNVTRRVTPFDAEQVDLGTARAALGHVRAPTDGRADDPAAVHPFQTRDLWLAHNGLLLNHADYAHWRPAGLAPIDSTVIIGGIQHQLDAGLPIVDAIRQTVEVLEGQQACWLWHVPSGMVYLWRVMSPIYVTQTVHWLAFSSIRGAPSDTLLREGVIYRIDPAALTIAECATFAFYNPFRAAT